MRWIIVLLLLLIAMVACSRPDDPTCQHTHETRKWLQIVAVGKVMVPIWHKQRQYQCADHSEWRNE